MRSQKRKKDLGEVFTPIPLVNEMLDKFPAEVWNDSTKTWIDPSCGNGNFLVEVLRRLIDSGHHPITALALIHGVDIMMDNVEECRDRMFALMPDDPSIEKVATFILERNLVCADALRYHYRFDGSHPYDDEI